MSRMQREYQRMVTSESAYWSMQAAIEGAKSESENPPDGAAPELTRAIRFENVGFRYRDQWILRNVALTIPAGGITVIVGPSGAGKTTVIDLVTALLRPQEGEVWIDELPLQRVDWRAWRRMIGYVPQDTILLHDTVRNNVTLGDPELTAMPRARCVRRASGTSFRPCRRAWTRSLASAAENCPAASASAWCSRAPLRTSRAC
jgi:ATP-binding cassette subfamily C protein